MLNPLSSRESSYVESSSIMAPKSNLTWNKTTIIALSILGLISLPVEPAISLVCLFVILLLAASTRLNFSSIRQSWRPSSHLIPSKPQSTYHPQERVAVGGKVNLGGKAVSNSPKSTAAIPQTVHRQAPPQLLLQQERVAVGGKVNLGGKAVSNSPKSTAAIPQTVHQSTTHLVTSEETEERVAVGNKAKLPPKRWSLF